MHSADLNDCGSDLADSNDAEPLDTSFRAASIWTMAFAALYPTRASTDLALFFCIQSLIISYSRMQPKHRTIVLVVNEYKRISIDCVCVCVFVEYNYDLHNDCDASNQRKPMTTVWLRVFDPLRFLGGRNGFGGCCDLVPVNQFLQAVWSPLPA